MLLRVAAILIVTLQLVGCASLPKADPYTEAPVLIGEIGDRVVYLPKCDEELPESADLYCRIRLTDLYNSLVRTEIFREVTIGEEPVGAGNFVIDIHDFDRTPYWSTPVHNPGLLILSLGIPFWWHESLGFRFSIRELPDGNDLLVDTRWEGTSVMWSLASLLNALPSQTFRSTFDQDISRVREALVGK